MAKGVIHGFQTPSKKEQPRTNERSTQKCKQTETDATAVFFSPNHDLILALEEHHVACTCECKSSSEVDFCFVECGTRVSVKKLLQKASVVIVDKCSRTSGRSGGVPSRS